MRGNSSFRFPGQPTVDSAYHRGRRKTHVTLSLDSLYDPSVPNDYDGLRRELEIKARKARASVPIIVKPVSTGPKLSADEAHARRLKLLEEEERRQQAREPTQQPEEPKDIGLKIMQKLGWREGKGLGANEQGIMAPLVAKPTGRNIGVIVPDQRSMLKKKPTRCTSGFDAPFGKSHSSAENMAPQPPVAVPADPGDEICTVKLVCRNCTESYEYVSETFEEILCEFGSVVNFSVKASPEHQGFIIYCEYEEASQARAAVASVSTLASKFNPSVELEQGQVF